MDSAEPLWLSECLDKLGASVVRHASDALPQGLRTILRSREPIFDFDKVLAFLETIQHSIPRQFALLDQASQARFADWTRVRIIRTPIRFYSLARSLPIWPELQSIKLYTATELRMLPSNIPAKIAAPFIHAGTVEYSESLVHLQIPFMTVNQLSTALKIPNTIDKKNQYTYKKLLTLMISSSSLFLDRVFVPNGHGEMVKAATLYMRRPLFAAAFGNSPKHFLLDNYRDLEPRLVSCGLKTPDNLDFDTFKLCAEAVNEATSGGRAYSKERARPVFRAYCEDLPLRVASTQEYLWAELDTLRFIPRNNNRQRSMRIPGSLDYAMNFRDVVSPAEALRADFEAIAWTQRALINVRPKSRVLIANPTFGQPTIVEVVSLSAVLQSFFANVLTRSNTCFS